MGERGIDVHICFLRKGTVISRESIKGKGLEGFHYKT